MLLNTAALSRLQAQGEPRIRKTNSNLKSSNSELTWSEHASRFSAIATLLSDDVLELNENMEVDSESSSDPVPEVVDPVIEDESSADVAPRSRARTQSILPSPSSSSSNNSSSTPSDANKPRLNKFSSYTQSIRLARHESQNGLRLKWMKESMPKPVNFSVSRDNTKLFGQAMLSVPSMKLFHKWKRVFFIVDCFTMRLYSSLPDMEKGENSLFELVLDVELRVGPLRRSSTLFKKISTISEKTKAALEGIPAEIIEMSKANTSMHYFKTYYKDFDPMASVSSSGSAFGSFRGTSPSQSSSAGLSFTSRVRSISAKSKATAVALHAPSENGYCKLAFESLAEAECLREVLKQATKHTINPELDPSLVNMASK